MKGAPLATDAAARLLAAELAVISPDPKSPDHYKAMLPDDLPLVHVTCEVRPGGEN